ncbi:MAG: hypothetical protein RXQ94_02565 [Caldivirga sp.]|uniref:hypothetical protein n=1 Tax=Caldivirga sp. MU80 TaxID=1650354 RepID=UPI000A51D3A9|nr:hypothetical protein [Caldivirga sp. MU80]NAZ29220.1 hypothetical protein [Caldivirga sp.]
MNKECIKICVAECYDSDIRVNESCLSDCIEECLVSPHVKASLEMKVYKPTQ